ncbi:MAG: hypothetical protein WC789_02795 [Lentisphaeria bacterium]|jgi:polyhydroxyalkanoate synthesis regulator phasin
MLDLLKKGIYIGLGLASMTKEKADALAKEVTEKAKLTEEEGRKFASALEEESKKAQDQLRTTVEALVEKAVKVCPGCKLVKGLERRLAALEAKCGGAPAGEAEPPCDEPGCSCNS